MNYDRAWERLKREVGELSYREVRGIDPEIFLAYMGFIEQIEDYEEELELKRKLMEVK